MNKIDFLNLIQKTRELNTVLKEDRKAFSVRGLQKNSFIKINNNLYKIEDSYTYTYKNESWKEFQLLNLKTGEIKYIEIEEDDVIKAYFTEEKIKLNDLNVSADKIESIADNEKGSVSYKGIVFEYEDDYKVIFKRDGKDKTEKVYLYEFESTNKNSAYTYLTVEEWDEGDNEYSYEVFLSKEIPINNIEIIAI